MSNCVTIAIDGPDGTGKTTQISLLKSWLESNGKSVLLTKSSGGTPIGHELRNVSLSNISRPAETDLYISLAMGVALTEHLESSRQDYDVIIIDRSPLAIIAYQNYGAQLKNKQLGLNACEKLLHDWQIDLLIVFDVDDNELATRNAVRSQTDATQTTNYFEKQDHAFFIRVKEGYGAGMTFASSLHDLKTDIIKVDAGSSIDSVSTTLMNIVETYLERVL